MKILHTADLHLGAPMRAHLPPREAKLRRDELLSTLHRILLLAKKEGCEAILIAGDLFDNEAAAAMLAPTVLAEIEKNQEIDFYYAQGNHEGCGWLPAILPKNLHIFGNSFAFFEKGNITFCGKSAPKRSDFLNISLQKRRINILVLHGAWSERDTKSLDIPLGLLKDTGVDYCALGHYHSYSEQRIDSRGVAVYCGCPEGRGFDEAGQKGVVLIDTAFGHATHRFIPLPGRILHNLTVDISAAESLLDVFSRCEAAVASVKSDDLVRLVLSGSRASLPAPDTEAIERHFRQHFYYIEVEDTSTAAPDFTSIASEHSLRGAFVRAALANETLEQEERMRILSLGLAALRGNSKGGAPWN